MRNHSHYYSTSFVKKPFRTFARSNYLQITSCSWRLRRKTLQPRRLNTEISKPLLSSRMNKENRFSHVVPSEFRLNLRIAPMNLNTSWCSSVSLCQVQLPAARHAYRVTGAEVPVVSFCIRHSSSGSFRSHEFSAECPTGTQRRSMYV